MQTDVDIGKKKRNKKVIIAIVGGIIATCVLCVVCVLCVGVPLLLSDLVDNNGTETTIVLLSDTASVAQETLEPAVTLTSPPSATSTIQPSPNPTSTLQPTPTSSDPDVIALSSDIEGSQCLPTDAERQYTTFAGITDGDTIQVFLDGVEYPVRYIGMDTPEMDEPDGAVSRDKNYELVANKELTLIKDVSDTDRYDRLLRYVIADGKFVNYELVRQGYASAGSWPPDTSCDQMFKDAEQKARDEKLGLWAALPPAAEEPGKVVIADIFYNGVKSNQEPDEYVEIRNDDAQPIQLQGWTLRDKANHKFTFPEYIIQPGQICKVYTNEYHPEWCNFNYVFSSSAIWNNGGDCAYLMDAQGKTISEYCY